MRILILLLLVSLVMGELYYLKGCESICFDCGFNGHNGCDACKKCRQDQRGIFTKPYKP